jgi:hypothetical protein
MRGLTVKGVSDGRWEAEIDVGGKDGEEGVGGRLGGGVDAWRRGWEGCLVALGDDWETMVR